MATPARVPDRSAGASVRTGGQTYYLFPDHLGGTHITASGTNGAELGKLLYKPWGETRLSTGTTLTTWRFTGQREDATIGLYYYGARYYDSALGRFAQPDTIVPNPGDPQSLNRYSYTLNNPIKYRDPSGHAFASPEGGGSGAIAIAAGYALASQAGQALNVVMADAQAFFQQLGNLAPAVTDQLANRGQASASSSSNAGNAAPGDPDQNDPFRGLSEAAQRGVDRLQKLSNHPIQRFARGYQAQLIRAEHWAQQGQLTGVEESGPGGVRYDLVLRGQNSIVEVKY